MTRAHYSTADIIAVVTAAAHPLTTLEVAAALKAKVGTISSRLSKLADRRMIAREPAGAFNDAGFWVNYCTWSAAQ